MVLKPSHVLDDIVAAYDLERDLLRIAIRRSDWSFLVGTGFVGRPVSDSQADVERLRSRLDEMTVVMLWIEFERHLTEHILSRMNVLATTPAPFNAQLSARMEHLIEYSRVDDLLDLYKGWIDSAALGSVKQIKDFRDWVRHRNPRRRKPAIVVPSYARTILGDVMDQMV